MSTPYSGEFFKDASRRSRLSASAILPLIVDVIQPKRVVDIGCGTGTWIGVLADQGIEVVGVDGGYVDRSQLEFPQEQFIACDLEKPLPALGFFELAISMETAEHLSEARAESFIGDLTQLAPVILFSAAVPAQGGTNHVNEQWPSYWVSLFKKYDFAAIDCIRPQVWETPNIAWWYAQNAFLAVSNKTLESNEKLKLLSSKHGQPMSLVHPNHYLEKTGTLKCASEIRNHSLSKVLPVLPSMLLDFALGRRGGKK